MSTGFLPEPLQDELLYGLLGRHRRLIGGPAAASHTAALFGTRTAIASSHLQGRLGILAARLEVPGMDALCLLHEHTLFPYYSAFQPAETVELVKRELIGSSGSSAFVKLGLAAFGITTPKEKLRVCPSCHSEQIKRAGSATWLRSHQLPGNLVCHFHGDVLVAGEVAQGSDRGRHEFLWLSDDPPSQRIGSWTERQSTMLKRLARQQAEIFQRGRPTRLLSDWKPHYRQELATRDLMRSSQKVDQGRFAGAVADTLGPILLLLPEPCRALGEGGWPGLMVREHRKAMHPLFHVLMEIFLAQVPSVVRPRTLAASPSRVRADQRTPRAVRRPLLRRNWLNEDRRASMRLKHAKILIMALKPPRRVTFAALEKQAFSPGWLLKRRELVPGAFKAAHDLSEDDETFLLRRLLYWESALGIVPAWRICRAAGIRHHRWRDAVSLLSRSKQTADRSHAA